MKAVFKEGFLCLTEDGLQFFKLFLESTKDGSRAAALEMSKIAKRQTEYNQMALLFISIRLLVYSDSEKLLWPNSPLFVLLQFVDPNVLSPAADHDASEEDHSREPPLHMVADLADPSDYSTHKTSSS
jgi:hypothetical protein